MNKERGFLFFYDWLPAFEGLTPKDFKTLFLAMCRYQMDGTPPPDFSGKAKVLETLIFPQLDRRKYLSSIGKKGAEARYRGNAEEKQGIGGVGGTADHGENAVALAIDKDKDKTKTKSQSESEKSEAVASPDEGERATDGFADARAEREGIFLKEDGFAEGDRGWGRHGNVILSTEEYLSLRQRIPDADAYIDRFSEKLKEKGYRYSNHYKAIMEWWDRDQHLDLSGSSSSGRGDGEEPCQGTFDTDSFFEAAVRRSLGGA